MVDAIAEEVQEPLLTEIRTLKEEIASLRADLEILRAHKASAGNVVTLASRDICDVA